MAEKQHTQTRPEDHVPVPLVMVESPDTTQQLARYHSSLLEVIHLLSEREGEELAACIPDLISIARETAQIINRSVTAILTCYEEAERNGICQCPPVAERGPHPGGRPGIEYHDTPARTRQVAALSVTLMRCIDVIARREDDQLKVYLDDLIDVAWEMSLALKGCTEATLGENERCPDICGWCRGECGRGGCPH